MKQGRLERQLNVRVDAAFYAALEQYRSSHAVEVNLPAVSDAARFIIGRVLRSEGLL